MGFNGIKRFNLVVSDFPINIPQSHCHVQNVSTERSMDHRKPTGEPQPVRFRQILGLKFQCIRDFPRKNCSTARGG